MAERLFDRDTLLDLTVNVIPLGIIGFFIGLYTIYRPFGWELGTMGIVYALHVIPFVGLAILTYISARAISRDEKDMEKTATEHDVGEQPRTHRYTGDSSEGADGDSGVGIDRENTAGEATGPAATDTTDTTDGAGDSTTADDTTTDDAGSNEDAAGNDDTGTNDENEEATSTEQ